MNSVEAVKDLSLGDSHYAQVRIMVDGTHYLKGMAVYSDNMPDGVDVFSTLIKSLALLQKMFSRKLRMIQIIRLVP